MRPLRIAVWHNLPSGGGKRLLHDHVAGLLARGHHVESWCPSSADQSYLPLSGICRESVLPLRPPSVAPRSLLPRPFYPVRLMSDRLAAMDEHCRLCAEQIDAGRFDVLFGNACMRFRTTPIARHIRLPALLYAQEPYRALYEALPDAPWAALPPATSGRWSLKNLKRVVRDLAARQAMRIQVREEVANAAAFDRILVNSSFSRESVLRAYGLESRVCRPAVDLRRFRPTGEARGSFAIAVGGLDILKGSERAILALAAVPESARPPLVWVGNFADEEYAAKVRRLAAESKVSFDLKVRVSDDELVSLLSRARMMIYTPRLEPFGLAPLEANACGTPVVGIAEGGLRETIEDGVTGLLAPDADPAALGALVQRFAASPSLADEMGRAARAHVERKWGLERAIDELERHLGEVAAQGVSIATRSDAHGFEESSTSNAAT